jgi:hypothetical protein
MQPPSINSSDDEFSTSLTYFPQELTTIKTGLLKLKRILLQDADVGISFDVSASQQKVRLRT